MVVNKILERELISGVVDKAQGVFLWGTLVVGELVKQMGEGGTESELTALLSSLPEDLRGLYDRILKKIPSSMIGGTVNYLGIMRVHDEFHSTRILTLDEFSIAAQPPADVLNRMFPGEEEEVLWIKQICENMNLRLRSRCRGLVEVTPPTTKPSMIPGQKFQRVQFLHITVRDFIQDPYVWDNMRNRALAEGQLTHTGSPMSTLTNSNLFLVGLQLQTVKTA
jgi:hypothetical protein